MWGLVIIQRSYFSVVPLLQPLSHMIIMLQKSQKIKTVLINKGKFKSRLDQN